MFSRNQEQAKQQNQETKPDVSDEKLTSGLVYPAALATEDNAILAA